MTPRRPLESGPHGKASGADVHNASAVRCPPRCPEGGKTNDPGRNCRTPRPSRPMIIQGARGIVCAVPEDLGSDPIAPPHRGTGAVVVPASARGGVNRSANRPRRAGASGPSSAPRVSSEPGILPSSENPRRGAGTSPGRAISPRRLCSHAPRRSISRRRSAVSAMTVTLEGTVAQGSHHHNIIEIRRVVVLTIRRDGTRARFTLRLADLGAYHPPCVRSVPFVC